MLIVIGCSSKKLQGTHRAQDLYTGKVFLASLAAARCLTTDKNIRILSGRFGLLELTEMVSDYDEQAAGASCRSKLQEQAADLPCASHLFLTKRYAAIAKQVWPTAISVFEGSRGGVSQLVRCYKILKGLI